MPVPNAISVTQLYRLVGTPECPLIVDVRLPEDFDDDPRMVAGAVKINFDAIDDIIQHLPDKKSPYPKKFHQAKPQHNVVIYCQKGLKISQGTAALLRTQGIKAEFLEGGQFAWRNANAPMVLASSIPYLVDKNYSQWVTRHRPKIDRLACPWLIKRFVNASAKILFVEPSQVLNVAERFNATPFDVAGVQLSHQGDLCSFDAMLKKFGLDTDETLLKMATIIRAADTNCHDLAPEAKGLLAISVGLSRMYRDDLAMLDAGMLVYDALYRWARDASDETHEHSFVTALPEA